MIRLFAIGLVGYMAYEFFQGMSQGSGNSRREQGSDVGHGVHPGIGSMTGPGQGKRVQTEDAAGAGGSHVVGRGVVL